MARSSNTRKRLPDNALLADAGNLQPRGTFLADELPDDIGLVALVLASLERSKSKRSFAWLLRYCAAAFSFTGTKRSGGRTKNGRSIVDGERLS